MNIYLQVVFNYKYDKYSKGKLQCTVCMNNRGLTDVIF